MEFYILHTFVDKTIVLRFEPIRYQTFTVCQREPGPRIEKEVPYSGGKFVRILFALFYRFNSGVYPGSKYIPFVFTRIRKPEGKRNSQIFQVIADILIPQ